MMLHTLCLCLLKLFSKLKILQSLGMLPPACLDMLVIAALFVRFLAVWASFRVGINGAGRYTE